MHDRGCGYVITNPRLSVIIARENEVRTEIEDSMRWCVVVVVM